MPRKTYHSQVIRQYLLSTILRDIILPAPDHDLEQITENLNFDISVILAIRNTRYLQTRSKVPKSGNLHLAWEYSKNPEDHSRFINMLRVSPCVFEFILDLIKDHKVFHNNSNIPQTPVDIQLAVTLYRMGRFGNGASLEDMARHAGYSEGAIEKFTHRCFEAIESLHDMFVRPITAEEKEKEKVWMDEHLGFKGLWREGWLMYDGTIVVLYEKPGMHGDAYYTRKANYGLNVQIGNTPSNLRIVDYSHGFPGSAHDAAAFEHTCAAKHPDWFFEGEEFAWADSAYTLNSRTIPIHRQPASFRPENAMFDRVLSYLRVRSEHCIGALKGRFQSLRGLRVNIRSNEDHKKALQWVTVAIILHNLIIDVEGYQSGATFAPFHTRAQEAEDRGDQDLPFDANMEDAGGEKRSRLVAELLAYRQD